MANPICLSPLKFYDSLAKQSHHKSYAYNHITPLITKTGWIPPFQFIIPTQLYEDSTGVFSVHICDSKTNEAVYVGVSNATGSYINQNYGVRTIDGYKVFMHAGKQPIPISNGSIIKTSTDIGYYYDVNGNIQQVSNYSIDYYNISGTVSEIHVKARIGYDAYIHFFDENDNILSSYHGNNSGTGINFNQTCSVPSGCIRFVVSYVTNVTHIVDIVSVHEGLYYIKITSDNGGLWTYYSEVFCFTNVTKDCLELEYWNETGNFSIKNGIIAFPSDFHFKLLLKGEIGKPEYNFEEESTKRLGYVYVESQVSKKTYKFNAVVPEYICDTLRIVRLCDNKIIRCKDDEYEAISFEMEADWQTQGDLASVTCEFETDNVIANIGGFVPDKLGGDYNNDYDDDFDKE